VRSLEWYVWLRLELRKGLRAVEEEGGEWDEEKRRKERSRVSNIMRGERERDSDEEAQINLLWWNGDGRLREGVREGIRLEQREEIDRCKLDNYNTAEAEKAVAMCDEIIGKGTGRALLRRVTTRRLV
jgi:hypothetical protein